MTQRDLQPLISDAMDEGDMRQETRDLATFVPFYDRLTLPSETKEGKQ
jgi:hypothetical protein